MDISFMASVIDIKPSESFGNTEVQKVWVQTEENYPQVLEITFINKPQVVKNICINQRYKFFVNLNGKIKSDKVYNSLIGWKFETPTS